MCYHVRLIVLLPVYPVVSDILRFTPIQNPFLVSLSCLTCLTIFLCIEFHHTSYMTTVIYASVKSNANNCLVHGNSLELHKILGMYNEADENSTFLFQIILWIYLLSFLLWFFINAFYYYLWNRNSELPTGTLGFRLLEEESHYLAYSWQLAPFPQQIYITYLIYEINLFYYPL